MSKQLQLIYDEIAQKKVETRDLKSMYKDALVQADGYEELVEQIAGLREKKKEIEDRIKAQLGRAWEKIEDLKYALETDKKRMNDEALNNLMAGVTVSVKDSYDNEYEPEWSVKFIKKQN